MVEGGGRPNYFLAIPFAPPPVGDLRWKPPVGRAASGLDRRARRHQGRPPAELARDESQIEDCALFANVVRPAEGVKPGAKLPVIFWIPRRRLHHGLGDRAPFGADTEGTEFAKKGVILVSANHRLGRAGWFAHPALTKEGGLIANYGNMDQIAGAEVDW